MQQQIILVFVIYIFYRKSSGPELKLVSPDLESRVWTCHNPLKLCIYCRIWALWVWKFSFVLIHLEVNKSEDVERTLQFSSWGGGGGSIKIEALSRSQDRLLVSGSSRFGMTEQQLLQAVVSGCGPMQLEVFLIRIQKCASTSCCCMYCI